MALIPTTALVRCFEYILVFIFILNIKMNGKRIIVAIKDLKKIISIKFKLEEQIFTKVDIKEKKKRLSKYKLFLYYQYLLF